MRAVRKSKESLWLLAQNMQISNLSYILISNLSYILWRPLGSMENTGHSKQKAIEYIYHICDVSKYVRSVCVCVQFLVKGDLLQFPFVFHQVIVLGQGICWLSIRNNTIRTRTIELASGFIDFYYSKQEICQSMTPWNFFLQKLRHFSTEKELVYI